MKTRLVIKKEPMNVEVLYQKRGETVREEKRRKRYR